MDKPPVRRDVGTNPRAILDFIAEAERNDYPTVFLASDSARALLEHIGAPTSMKATVIGSEYIPPGMALAMPPASPNMWSASGAF